MTEKDEELPAREHGIEGGFYSNSPYGLIPALCCLCGFTTGNACTNWQDAGEELDAHLEARRHETF